ncbi:MFS transporter [Microlunatus soli]|uniref:Predicted arabinose efflux permease, MFS family n=1 Tax=Microlunatus soli TaxID=630515 RepID=A0A1H1REG0_9ACTN|nr:MFS transporter [Microlunatus soli]SDS34088.1 Predicted arabinose efflux permease, MFS family [Microlunatus soli]
MNHTPASSDADTADHSGSVWLLPGMRSLAVVSLLGFGGFDSLISVVPLWVVRGGANETGAGLVTTVMLLATVLTQTFVPRMLGRFGLSVVLSAGLITLGLPAVGFGLSSDLAWVLLLSAVRGFGFGILTVTGSAVVGDLAPPSRHGAAIGAYGLAIALPNLIFLPFSVVAAETFGFGWVFAAGAMPLVGVPAAMLLGRAVHRHNRHAHESSPEQRAGRRTALLRLWPPAAILLSVTLAGGAVMTFLPQLTNDLTTSRAGIWSAAGLLAFTATGAFTRWWIGHLADRRGAGRMMIPLLFLGALGMGLLAASLIVSGVALMIIGVALAGCAYGALQNLTLLSAFQQVRASQYGTASAVWNIGFDSGTAIGAMLLGVVATSASFAAGVIVLGALMLIAVPLAWRLATR